MSTFPNGRRAPNVSQYIANLNTIPTSQDLASQNEFDLAGDGLDFLNTEFFDFDASTFEQQQQGHHAEIHQAVPASATASAYPYPDYQSFAAATFSQSPSNSTQSPPSHVQPSYPQAAALDAVLGDKRKATVAQLTPVDDLEDESRAAAEEDKRRRNTAASARFRVKKKQREQALEKQAKEMNDKIKTLENKVTQLEMENKWLKGLITEKSDPKTIQEQLANFESKPTEDKEVDSSTDARNDGVGTEAVEN